MLCSSLCACLGQLFWKLSAERGFLWLFLGFALYGIGALFMLTGYKFGQLSVLQPVLSLNYVVSLILGALVLHESASLLKWAGVLCIMLGVVLIAGGDAPS